MNENTQTGDAVVTADPAKPKAKRERTTQRTTKPSTEQVKAAKQTLDANDKAVQAMAKQVTADGTKLGAMITAIKRSSDKLRRDVDICAASCIVHAIVHGNVTPARQLLVAMGEGMRTNAMRSFFEGCGPFVYEARGDDDADLHFDKSRSAAFKKDYNKDKLKFASNLMANPYYRFRPEAPYQGFNLREKLESLIKTAKAAPERAAKAKADGRGVEGDVNIDGLEQLEKLYHKLSAE